MGQVHTAFKGAMLVPEDALPTIMLHGLPVSLSQA
jgi:hypothetical protein